MKMINKKKRLVEFLVLGILILAVCPLVSAIAVASPYYTERPLVLYPGGTETVMLSLQNSDTERTAVYEAEILEGSEIASLDKTSYKVPYKSVETFAKLKVKIPSDATVGSQYLIKYQFSSAGEGEGQVSLGTSVTRGFNVIIIEKPKTEIVEIKVGESVFTILLIVLIVAILVIIYLLFRLSITKPKIR